MLASIVLFLALVSLVFLILSIIIYSIRFADYNISYYRMKQSLTILLIACVISAALFSYLFYLIH